tara:strand:+ start:399 stop:542 length:144 start_codon:yes stop_codon:yes gene_type:complete
MSIADAAKELSSFDYEVGLVQTASAPTELGGAVGANTTAAASGPAEL